MNAPTVTPKAGTPKTSNTVIATGVNSPTNERIDSFIEELFKEANSEQFSSISSTAQTAKRHGFTNCANTRYVDYLAEYRNNPLRATFLEKYPSCRFLPYKALLNLLKTLTLSLDTCENYVGAIPPEQIDWLDLFDLDVDDLPYRSDICELLGDDPKDKNIRDWLDGVIGKIYRSSDRYHDSLPLGVSEHVSIQLKPFMKPFLNQFFVVAPKEAFQTSEDFIVRLRKLAYDLSIRPTIAPNDPLVIRFVKGGCLVVAAWGDEAAYINGLVKTMGA